MATKAQYRTELAGRMNDIFFGVAVSGTTTTVVVQTLITSDTNADTGRYNGAWIYNATTNQQRQIKNGSYVLASGAVTVTTPWTAPTLGDSIFITWVSPCETAPFTADPPYLTFINRALRRIAHPDQVTVTITTAHYMNITQLWVDRPERLLRVREPAQVVAGETIDSSWRHPELEMIGTQPTLHLRVPFLTATGTLVLDVIRPAHTWIRVATVWAESTVGLVNESDEARATLSEVTDVALLEACQVLPWRAPGRPNGPTLEMYQAAYDRVSRMAHIDMTQLRAPAQTAQEAAA